MSKALVCPVAITFILSDKVQDKPSSHLANAFIHSDLQYTY